MTGHPWQNFVIQLTVWVMVAGAAGAAGAVAPVVKSTCMISWDPSEDDTRITEYRITVWMVNGQRAAQKTTHVVKAPTTQVSCKEVGATKIGQLAGNGSGVPQRWHLQRGEQTPVVQGGRKVNRGQVRLLSPYLGLPAPSQLAQISKIAT